MTYSCPHRTFPHKEVGVIRFDTESLEAGDVKVGCYTNAAVSYLYGIVPYISEFLANFSMSTISLNNDMSGCTLWMRLPIHMLNLSDTYGPGGLPKSSCCHFQDRSS